MKKTSKRSVKRGCSMRRTKPRYYVIVAWKEGDLIAWYWGGIHGWVPADRAVFFMDEEAAGSEKRRIDKSVPGAGGMPAVVDVAKWNKARGLSIAPQPELLKKW